MKRKILKILKAVSYTHLDVYKRQVLVITGKAYYDDYKDVDLPKNVVLLPFTEELIQIMKDTYHLAEYGESDAGVTIVELK